MLALGSAGTLVYLKYVGGGFRGTEVGGLERFSPSGEPVNFLILGSDSREALTEEEQRVQGTVEDVGGRRSDTLILVHIDPKTEKAVLVHFPRDLRVAIPGHGEDKINTAYQTGGSSLVVKTVKGLTGLPIHHYVEVDFGGFRKVVDALGGVRLCIDRPMVDEVVSLRLSKPGCYELDGRQALKFVRARNVDGDAIPDFARIARQQQFIRAMLNKLLNVGSLLDPSRVRLLAEQVTPDKGLTIVDMVNLADSLKGLAGGSGASGSVDFRVVPSAPDPEDPGFVLADVARTAELFRRLKSGEPLGSIGAAQPGTEVSPAAIKVKILDASSGGKAKQVEAILLGAGFRVLGVEKAPPSFTKSGLYYRPGREQKAETVAGFFPKLVPREGAGAPFATADVVVVIAAGFGGVS